MNAFIEIGGNQLVNPSAIAYVVPNGSGIKIYLITGKELTGGLSMDGFKAAISKKQ